MRKGFTLIEVLTVVIIVGILGALGLGQYSSSIEKSRSAEAREVIGAIRSLAVAHWHQFSAFNAAGNVFNNAAANIGAGAGNIPDAANPKLSHYFTYGVAFGADPVNEVNITATRCPAASACKDPTTSWGGTSLSLTVTMPDGDNNWAIPAPWD